ncbi:AzlD domain-containing protein [Oceanidesulfovibrio marinus]|uniref:AzlD domain-containing protein n=1 Tax=Oceanidesulfovibrio marinus TaxID=370038 RepID=A0A6P1ZDA0_9BACT|nr:AzlD domain-containing protein [Oceanidesulfovibrio marinus]TVM32316.1 AzlD domain-containing protein [Oceanidesulfovibrio marinus]
MIVDDAAFWGVVAILSAGTFLMRFSFFALIRGTVSPRFMTMLRPIPAAVLAALVAPAILTPGGGLATLAVSWQSGKIAAGLVAAVVAWRTRHMFMTIAAGLVALWLWRFLL